MKQQFHYATITEAIENLHQQGYVLDFNLETGRLIAGNKAYLAEEFEIADLYRYEGASDPGDEATVYALVSKTGVKGLLVSGYGISSDSASEETLKLLHYKYQQQLI
ncbi:MAG: phosphoribosylpyrophosphate synthetase [Sphingobacteriales bacterium]